MVGGYLRIRGQALASVVSIRPHILRDSTVPGINHAVKAMFPPEH
jgi:hypothetical protein